MNEQCVCVNVTEQNVRPYQKLKKWSLGERRTMREAGIYYRSGGHIRLTTLPDCKLLQKKTGQSMWAEKEAS